MGVRGTQAAMYYVSTSGSDTNNGTSPSTPWAHHPWDLSVTAGSLAANTVLSGVTNDIVYMKKGDFWWDCQIQTKQSGVSGHQIVTTSDLSFGSGSSPVCSGSYDTTGYNSGWTRIGATNVWWRNLETTATNIVVYNGAILLKDSGASVGANKWFFSSADIGQGVNVLYVNIGGDPSSATAWRVGKRSIPLYIRNDYLTFKDTVFEVGNGTVVGLAYIETHTGITLDGLTLRYGGINALSDDNGILNEVKNCILSDIMSNIGVPGAPMLKIINTTNGSYHDNFIIGGAIGIQPTIGATGTNYIYNNQIHDLSYYYTTGNFGIKLSIGDGWQIYGNTIYNVSNANGSAVFGIYVTTNLNSIYDNVIHDVRGHGIYLKSANLNNVYNNEIYNSGLKKQNGSWVYYRVPYTDLVSGYTVNSGGGGAINVIENSENNNIYRNYVHENYVGITNYTTGGAGNNIYHYNKVVNSVVNGMGIGSDGDPVSSNVIKNNTIIHNTAADNDPAYRGHGLFMQNSTPAGGSAVFANNIIYDLVDGVDTHALWIQADGTNAFIKSLKIDYNDIYTVIPGSKVVATREPSSMHTYFSTVEDPSGGYRGVSGIQTLSSKITGLDGIQANAEAHSIFSDPLFISPSDFHLQKISPAINAGVNVGLTSDYAGNPVPSGTFPDIGAYEFQDSTAPTTTADISTGLYNAIQTVTLSCEDGAGVGCDQTYYTLDGIDPTTSSDQYVSPIEISTTTTLKYFSQDRNGNSETVKTKTYIIDTTPPNTNITAHPDSAINSTDATFTFEADETATFQCKLDSEAYATCASPKGYTGLAEGAHTFSVKAIDAATNEDPTPAEYSFTVDTQVPTLSDLAPNGTTFPVSTTSTNLTLSTSENTTCKFATTSGTTYGEMTLFDSTNSTAHSTLITGLNPGTTYTYFIKCKDAINESSEKQLSFSIAPLETATAIEKIKIKVERKTNKFKDTIKIASTKFKLKSQDQNLANGSVKIYKGGKLWKTVSADASGAWSSTLKLGKNASEKIKVLFYDAFGTLIGNQSAKIKVDSEDPKFIKFITPFYATGKGSILYWEAKDNQDVDYYKVTFNKKTTKVKKARFTIPQLTPRGTYEIKVTAYDKVGNSATKKTWVRVW